MKKFTTVRSLTFSAALCFSAFLLSACAIFFPGNPDSEKTDGEQVKLTLTEGDESFGEEAAIGLVAQGVSFAAQEISTQLKNEAAKYSAQYSGSVSGEFYKLSWSADPSNTNAASATNAVASPTRTGTFRLLNKSVTIDRYTTLSDNAAPTLASEIVVDFEQPNDKSVFFLQAGSARVLYAKAKVKSSHTKVDLSILFTVTASWTGSDGKGNSNQTVGSGTLVLPQVPVGTLTNYTDAPRTEFIPAVPFSAIPAKSYPVKWGNFTLTAVVSEVDNYGAEIQKINTTLTNNYPTITNLTSIAVTILTNVAPPATTPASGSTH